MTVGAIVVTYNRKKLLEECLLALMAQTVPVKIVVVDNASTDETQLFCSVLAQSKKIEYYRLDKNLGGAGGFAKGIEYGINAGFDAVWVMDDDCICKSDTLEKMLLAAETEQEPFGFLASKVLWTNGKTCKMNRVTFMDKKRKVKTRYNLWKSKDYPRITAATFVSILIPRETVMAVGLPIEEYFIWGDDKEYTLRISDRFPCYFIPESEVIHKSANNAGSNITTDSDKRIGRYFYAYRNDYCTAKKRGTKEVLIYLAALILNTNRILFKKTTKKRKRLKTMWGGFIAGTKFRPDVKYVKRVNFDAN